MGKTIGRKVLTMVGILGVLLLGIVLANVSALSIIKGLDGELESTIEQYTQAARQGDVGQMQEMEENLTSILNHNITRIEGTYTFDMVLVVAIIFTIIGTVLVVLKTISGPARRANIHLNEIVHKIKESKGDLTERIQVQSKDEVGRLVTGINSFIENLQDIMKTIKTNSEKLLDASDRIVLQVSASSENAVNVSAATEELSASMEEISATLEEIATGSKKILAQVQTINGVADDGGEMVKDIKHRASNMYDETVKSKEETADVISSIKVMLETAVEESKTVEKINELTGDILNISSQTNLLALNASIEAARAGEVGKGFAVVADEIRVLADSSRDAANNIQNISNMVTSAVESLANNARHILNFVDEKVIQDYDRFVGVANQYQEDADHMDHIIMEFTEMSSHVETTMSTMNNSLGDISIAVDESAQGVTSVAENAVNLVNAISRIQQATEESQEFSAELQEKTKRFERV